MTRPLTLTPRQLDQAAHAWHLGSAALGAWAARNGFIQRYGELVKAVREYTGDDIDYSQETTCTTS